MKYLTLLALLLAPLCQAITLDDLQQRFNAQPTIRAHFEQVRTIKSMPKPLRSRGEMLMARDTGLLWDQTAPFPMTMMLNDTRMVQAMNGQPPQTITADSNPQMFQFNHLLRGLFRADRAVLEKNFRIDFKSLENGRWTLVLTPVTTPLDKIFTSIDLAGARYLETIRLNDRQGDRTDITLSNQRLTPATLTADERQRFAAP